MSLTEELQKITSIPTEVLFQTFDHLAAKDLKELALTCQLLRDSACRYMKTSLVWRLKDSGGVESTRFNETKTALVGFGPTRIWNWS